LKIHKYSKFDTLISLGRKDYWGAGISALGIIPYLGDLAKIGKLPKLLKIIENAIGMARTDARLAEGTTPLLSKIKNALDRLSINKLSKWVKKPIQHETLGRNARAGLPRITG